MKKFLLAGALLSAGTLSVNEANAGSRPEQQSRMALPKPVQDAFSALEAQFAANGYILTNVSWTKAKNHYTATYLIADMNSDVLVDGRATWLANGQRVISAGGSTTPE